MLRPNEFDRDALAEALLELELGPKSSCLELTPHLHKDQSLC